MADLIVIAYDDQFKAEEIRTKLRKRTGGEPALTSRKSVSANR
jgi:hypothetical protein